MTGQFRVHRDELVAAATAVARVGAARPGPLEPSAPEAPATAFGAPELARAVAEFTAAWETGHSCLIEECDALADGLRHAAHVYTTADSETDSDFRQILEL